MTKLYQLAIITLVFSPINAFSNENITKGVRSISGTISYDRYKYSSAPDAIRRLEISPKILYFITNGLGAGASLGYAQEKNSSYDFEGYGVGPFFRYYFPNENILPYVSFGYRYSKGKLYGESIADDEYTYKEKSAAVGADYFIATHVAIEVELKYMSGDRKIEYKAGFSIPDQTSESSYTHYNLGIGINVFF